LRSREHIVRELTKELLCLHTMTGGEVDMVIAVAVAAQAFDDECHRRSAWKCVAESAALFNVDGA
jgi:hypothetical protein